MFSHMYKTYSVQYPVVGNGKSTRKKVLQNNKNYDKLYMSRYYRGVDTMGPHWPD